MNDASPTQPAIGRGDRLVARSVSPYVIAGGVLAVALVVGAVRPGLAVLAVAAAAAAGWSASWSP